MNSIFIMSTSSAVRFVLTRPVPKDVVHVLHAEAVDHLQRQPGHLQQPHPGESPGEVFGWLLGRFPINQDAANRFRKFSICSLPLVDNLFASGRNCV